MKEREREREREIEREKERMVQKVRVIEGDRSGRDNDRGKGRE